MLLGLKARYVQNSRLVVKEHVLTNTVVVVVNPGVGNCDVIGPVNVPSVWVLVENVSVTK